MDGRADGQIVCIEFVGQCLIGCCLISLHPNSEGPKPVATPRPERLVNRLKSITLDDASAPRLVIVRQPRGPDNSKVKFRHTKRLRHNLIEATLLVFFIFFYADVMGASLLNVWK